MWKETVQLARRLISKIQSFQAALLIPAHKFPSELHQKMPTEQDTVADKDLLLPPPSVNGMKTLDREKFCKTISVPFLISATENLGMVLKVVKKYLLKMPNFNPVQAVDGTSQKKILFDPFKLKECFDSAEKEKFESSGFKGDDIKLCDISLTYDNWLAEGILKAVLPLDKEGVASWSTIGHIIHVNLRDHLLDYKYLIGQVLLDKNKQARTVVNKANTIDTTYRTFQIELLAGENDMLTQVKENHCSYEFDFSKVYWNSRLVGEHERVTNELKAGDVLYDVFAGVGPFSIPAAKRHCKVLANDLNPESFKWLQHNIKINKVVDQVSVFNKDGADFIRNDIKEDLMKRWAAGDNKTTHITMNLPAMAVDFLEHFRGLIPLKEKPSVYESPYIHVYCFIKNAEDSSKAAKELVELKLGAELGKNLKKVFLVRTVSNNKDMMRVSFTLSETVLFGQQFDEDEPAAKKLCTRDSDEQNC